MRLKDFDFVHWDFASWDFMFWDFTYWDKDRLPRPF